MRNHGRQRHLPSALAALLALSPLALAGDNPQTMTATEAPIFLPYYDEESWSLFRGSILSIDESASETSYTIFCPTEPTPSCDLSLEFPFVVVEGPHTVRFHGEYTSTYIAHLACDLDGTTAATCSGYSSYKSGYSNGLHTGPTEISWTSTLTGSDVEFGTLTLEEMPTSTDDSLANTATALSTPTTNMLGETIWPTPTGGGSDGEGAGTSLRAPTAWGIAATVATGMMMSALIA